MSSEAFNQLSNAEAERLACLAEECAEVIQIVGKILRHGYSSTHPDNDTGPDNREMLEEELGHVAAIRIMMHEAGDVNETLIGGYAQRKLERIGVYLHHNRPTPPKHD